MDFIEFTDTVDPSTNLVKEESVRVRNEKRRIRLVNYISIIAFASNLYFIIFYSIIGFQELSQAILILSIGSIFYLFPIVLNGLGFHFAAKLLLASFDSLLVMLVTLFYIGKDAGTHTVFLIFGIIPIFIWSSKERIYPIIFFILNIFYFIFIEFLDAPFHLLSEFPQEYVDFTRGMVILICFITATIVVIIFHRLTDEKEELLQLQNIEVEYQKKKLEELNIKLHNKIEELTSNQKSLDQANLVKAKIYSIIAHDLRSPLSTIYCMLDVLQNDFNELPPEIIKEQLTNIYKNTSNSFTLLDNLLDWSQMQTDKFIIRTQKVDLAKITSEVIALNNELLLSKEIKISNNLKNNQFALADKYMLSAILRNLISNAIKFTPKGGLINVDAAPYNNKLIKVNVSDTGMGLSNDEIEKLFHLDDSFIRKGTNNEKGSGLGLVICKEFIKKNGGEILVQSLKGKGSVFSFLIPKFK